MRCGSICMVILSLGFTSLGLADDLTPQSNTPAVQRAESLLNHEPSIRMVQVMALTHAGLDRRLMRNMQRRVRQAAWLPELGLKVSGGRDIRSRDVVSLELEDSSGDTSLTETRTGDVQIEATVKFRLSGIVYNPEEIDVARENRYSAHSRLALLKRVTDVYFARRRAQLETFEANPPSGTARRLRRLKVEQLTAELDGMTGGRFTRLLNGVSR